MKLSIIIVNWNTGDLLDECLQSVSDNLSVWPAQDSETVVVDNASEDNSIALARSKHTWVHFVENRENVGFARANNRALAMCSGQYLVLLNPDTKVLPHALDTLISFMDAHPEVGACGPLLLNADCTLQPSVHPMLTPGREFWRLIFLDRVWPRAHYPLERWGQDKVRSVEVIKGACLLLRREALEQVGYLDDRYFIYTEEMDLCYRLLKANWQLAWVPKARVIHYGEVSSRQMAEKMYVQLYRSKVQFHRKFGGTWRAAYSRFLLFLAYTPRWVFVALGRFFFPGLAQRERTYRRLLLELRKM